jgi:hypothetical protein
MLPLSIVLITARREPMLREFIDSLLAQAVAPQDVEIIVVDFYAKERKEEWPAWVRVVEPMPSVWYGPHRLTKQHWWGVASFRNTGLCLATKEWIAVADDRSVLGPQWLEAVRDAMEGNYVVAGSYEKTHNMIVEHGVIKSYDQPQSNGNFTGKDPRETGNKQPRKAPGQWVLGATSALPLEWALNVGGWPSETNGLGLEDCIFGQFLERSGYPIMYDERMKLWEDRTPGKCDVETIRSDRGKSPNDRSHALLKRAAGRTKSTHDGAFDLLEVRAMIRMGLPFPIPTEPKVDFWDGTPLSELKPQ